MLALSRGRASSCQVWYNPVRRNLHAIGVQKFSGLRKRTLALSSGGASSRQVCYKPVRTKLPVITVRRSSLKERFRLVAGRLLPARFVTSCQVCYKPVKIKLAITVRFRLVAGRLLPARFERLRPAVRGLLPARFGTTLSPNLHVLVLSGGRASSSRFVTNLSKQSYTCHHCSEVFCFARKNPAMKHVKHQHPNPCSSFEAFPLAVSRRIYLPP